MSSMVELRSYSTIAVLGFTTIVAGCGKTDDGRLASFPVHGSVTIDGKATKGVYVFLNPAQQPKTHGIFPNAITDDQGEYWVSTYDTEDGAPPGEYVVTVKWPEGQGLMVNSESPDRLKNRYSDPAKSATKVIVKEAKREAPNEVPALQLTSE